MIFHLKNLIFIIDIISFMRHYCYINYFIYPKSIDSKRNNMKPAKRKNTNWKQSLATFFVLAGTITLTACGGGGGGGVLLLLVALPGKNGLVVKRFGGVFPQIHFHTVVVSSNHCSNAYAPGHSESQCIQTPLFVTPAHPETNGLRSLWP